MESWPTCAKVKIVSHLRYHMIRGPIWGNTIIQDLLWKKFVRVIGQQLVSKTSYCKFWICCICCVGAHKIQNLQYDIFLTFCWTIFSLILRHLNCLLKAAKIRSIFGTWILSSEKDVSRATHARFTTSKGHHRIWRE